MRRALLLILVGVAGCTVSGGAGTEPPPPTPTTSAPATTTTPPPAPPAGPGCDETTNMVGAGTVFVADPAGSDTTTVGPITWQVEGGCERFVVEFRTAEGAPATTPPRSAVELLPGSQILRIRVAADSTVVTDQLVETPLVRRLYLVRAIDGGLFLDLHLTRPVRATAVAEESPARLGLQLEAGEEPAKAGPVVGDRVVVTAPLPGVEVGTELVVSGYARTFEANVIVIATAGDEVVARADGTAADWTETWGEFLIPLVVAPGNMSLFVGEESPADGSLEGVILSIRSR